jgi:tyrosine-protein kinase
MDLRQYVRVLLAHWVLLVVCILAGVGAAAALAWSKAPTYEADMQLFVTANGRGTLSEDYTGLLVSQQRAVTYSQLITSAPVLQRVSARIRQLGGGSPPQIATSVPSGSSLIDVTIRDRSAEQAKATADVLAVEFPPYVADLEGSKGGSNRVSLVTVHVTKPALLPKSPVAPRKPVYLTLGLVVGAVLGLLAAVLREAVDRRVRVPEDAAAAAGMPVLGSIGEGRSTKRRPLVMAADPGSEVGEDFRRLRTSLEVLLEKREAQGLVVVSPTESAGKTFVAANLAIAFAQVGNRVALVDADLRRPDLTGLMGVGPVVGLTDVFADGLPLGSALQTWREGLPLEVLGVTDRRQDAPDLLTPARFDDLLRQLTKRADVVIFDAPALSTATDAAILARARSLCTVIVARSRTTRARDLETAASALKAVDAQVLGVVLNGLRVHGHLPRLVPWGSDKLPPRRRPAPAQRPLSVPVERRSLDG